MAPPFKQAEFEIIYGEGISRLGEIIGIGVKLGFIEKAGAWYSYNGEKIGQGKEKVKNFLKENLTIAEELETRIREELLPQANDNEEPVEQ